MSRNISGQKISWNFCTSQTPQFKPRSEQEFVNAAWPKSLFSTPPPPCGLLFTSSFRTIKSTSFKPKFHFTRHDTLSSPYILSQEKVATCCVARAWQHDATCMSRHVVRVVTWRASEIWYLLLILFTDDFSSSQWRIQGVGAAAPPYWFIFLSKSRFLRVKGIYFVVHICDKWGQSW